MRTHVAGQVARPSAKRDCAPVGLGRGSALVLVVGLTLGFLPPHAVASAAGHATNGAVAFQLFTGDCSFYCETYADVFVTDRDAPEPPLRLAGSDERYDARPDWSPDGNRLVFAGYPYGRGYMDLYAMDSDGGNLQRLTNNYDNMGPRWSPDGSTIAFGRADHYSGFHTLWLMDADGGNQREVRGDYVLSSIAWLPDGRLTFWGNGNDFYSPANPPPGLYVTDVAGSDVSPIVTLDEVTAAMGEIQSFPTTIDWSAEGGGVFAARVPVQGDKSCSAAYDFQEDLVTVQPDGSGLRRVGATAGEFDLWEGAPAWAPDGTSIAFTGYEYQCVGEGRDTRVEMGPQKLYVVDAVGAGTRLVVDPPSTDTIHTSVNDPAWQPCTAATVRCGRPEGDGGFPTDPAPLPEPPADPAPAPAPAPAPDFVAPSPPLDVTAVAGDGSAEVSWSPPLDDGGSAVTAYTVYPTPDGSPLTVSADTATVTIPGLAAGQTYWFTVTATNGAGQSAPSEPSNGVVPLTTGPEVPDGFLAQACPDGQVPSSGFSDVAGNVHGSAIDCIVWYGITYGAGNGLYSPSASVRRDQMASFLARALQAAGVALPAPSDQGFRDLAGNVHADAVNQLAALGVAQGTSTTTFSPDADVRRDQLATFVDRAHAQVTGQLLPLGQPRFSDTAGNLHARAIDALAAAEIVRGVTADRYGPSLSVRRDQMASFIARHLGVLAEGGHVSPPS